MKDSWFNFLYVWFDLFQILMIIVGLAWTGLLIVWVIKLIIWLL